MPDDLTPEDEQEIRRVYRHRIANAQVVAKAASWLGNLNSAANIAFVTALNNTSEEVGVHCLTTEGQELFLTVSIGEDAAAVAKAHCNRNLIPVVEMLPAEGYEEDDIDIDPDDLDLDVEIDEDDY